MGEMKTPRWRMLQELHHQTILHYQNRKGVLNKNKKKRKKKGEKKDRKRKLYREYEDKTFNFKENCTLSLSRLFRF